MALYTPDVYDALHAKYTAKQCKAGGATRARIGKRHPTYKLYLKDDGTCTLPSGYIHGRAGGLARARKIKKDKEA